MYIYSAPRRLDIVGYVNNDCTITAFGNALGISYDMSRKFLQNGDVSGGKLITRKKNRTKPQMSSQSHIINMCELICSESKVFQSGPDKRYLKVSEFAREFNAGIWLVIVKGHMMAVIDGKVIDTHDATKRNVNFAYRVDLNHARQFVEKVANTFKMPVKKHFFANHVDEIFKEHKEILIKKEKHELARASSAKKAASEIIAKVLEKEESQSKDANEAEGKLIPYGF